MIYQKTPMDDDMLKVIDPEAAKRREEQLRVFRDLLATPVSSTERAKLQEGVSHG